MGKGDEHKQRAAMTKELRRVSIAVDKKVAAASRGYDVGELSEVARIFRNGEATNCFQVIAESGTFALQLFGPNSLDRVENMLLSQAQLAAEGVSCARPLLSNTGNYSSSVSKSVVAMFGWLEGTELADSHIPVPECVGRITGQLHTVSKSLIGPASIIPTIPQFLTKIHDAIGAGGGGFEEDLCTWMEMLCNAIPFCVRGTRGLVHGDLHHRNVIVSQDGTPYLIDFGNFEHHLLTKDIGTAAFYAITVDNRPDEHVLSRLLKAYCKVRPLSNSGIRQAVNFLRLKAVEFLAWQLLRYVRSETDVSTVIRARQSVLLVEQLTHKFP